jgi:tetratricopeptide (TPR) repeat protein
VNPPLQLDLFDERISRITRARNAMAELDLTGAERAYSECLSRYPDDAEARQGLDDVRRLAEIFSTHGGEKNGVAAWLGLKEIIVDTTKAAWHRRLAEAAEHRDGPGCEVDGVPVGLHYLAAGNLQEAERAIRDALRRSRDDARLTAYLGDVLFEMNEIPLARRSYLCAFLAEPERVDLGHLKDPDVASLLAIAENEYEIEGDVSDWIAAVGVVEGLFPVPGRTLPGLDDPMSATLSSRTPGSLFYKLICDERSARELDERVTLRRQMKAVCPTLFEAYLKRFR